jgi:hypothetical protein
MTVVAIVGVSAPRPRRAAMACTICQGVTAIKPSQADTARLAVKRITRARKNNRWEGRMTVILRHEATFAQWKKIRKETVSFFWTLVSQRG